MTYNAGRNPNMIPGMGFPDRTRDSMTLSGKGGDRRVREFLLVVRENGQCGWPDGEWAFTFQVW